MQHGSASWTWLQLRTALESRFGSEGQSQWYRDQLKMRRRRPGEPIQELYVEMSRLSSLAFPGPPSDLSHELSVEYFCTALNYASLTQRVLDTDPHTLEQAFQRALRMELHSAAAAGEPVVKQREKERAQRTYTSKCTSSKDEAEEPTVCQKRRPRVRFSEKNSSPVRVVT